MRISKTTTSSLDHTRWRHIWKLAWPIMLSNVTIPLVGAVDVAMMGRLDDPVFIGGVGLGMIVFNFIYFGLGGLFILASPFVSMAALYMLSLIHI